MTTDGNPCRTCKRTHIKITTKGECQRCYVHRRRYGTAWPAKGTTGGYVAGAPIDAIIGDNQILVVARRHGTSVAAAWSGRSGATVRRLRHLAGDRLRGPGRLTRAEIVAQAPRLTCDCRMCIEYRTEAMESSNRAYAGTAGTDMAEPDGLRWRDLAVCTDMDLGLFFPLTDKGLHANPETTPELFAPAAQVCASCPVRRQCLAYALANRIPHGVYGGLRPDERHVFRAPAGTYRIGDTIRTTTTKETPPT